MNIARMLLLPAALAGALLAQQTAPLTVKGLTAGAGLEVKLWAAEPNLINPTNIDIDSRGRIWVSYWNTGQVGMYDPAAKSWREWKLPGNAHAYAVWVDDQDKVWLTDWSTNAIVKFDPSTEKFESFASDKRGADVRQMLGRPGEVWGAESGNDRLVMVPAR